MNVDKNLTKISIFEHFSSCYTICIFAVHANLYPLTPDHAPDRYQRNYIAPIKQYFCNTSTITWTKLRGPLRI